MKFLTAGESHGPALTVIIDDFPAGVPISTDTINTLLAQRQQGYGRSARQKIEQDQVQILGGIRHGLSTGAPIALLIENRDFKNWQHVMNPDYPDKTQPITDERAFYLPRPGHADLAGHYKYGHTDLRDVLERASARETAARTAAGAVAQCLLSALGIALTSHVTMLGGIPLPSEERPIGQFDSPDNEFRCVGSAQTLKQMKNTVDEARKAGTTLGGEIEVIGWDLPPGLGSYAQWDRRLDGQLAQALMSIPAIKSVSIGDGDMAGNVQGHQFHDPIIPANIPNTLTRPSNRAGGLEGGVTNGMPLVLRAVMKPISTMPSALDSVNLQTGLPEKAHFERSDITAVPACAVVAQAMTAIILASAIQNKFGHDTLSEISSRLTQVRLPVIPASSVIPAKAGIHCEQETSI